MLSNNCSILLIDDDADVLDAYTQLLEQAGYHVSACNNPFDAREQVPKDWPGIVLSDVCMPGCSGIDLMTLFHQDDDLLPILLITGHGDVPMAVEAVKKGAWDFLQKPIDPGKLLTLVDAALRQRQSVIARRQYCQQKLQVELIGRSQWTVRYRQRLQQLAETDIAVWLYGEPGTGRMTGARYLHQLGRHAEGPFIACELTPANAHTLNELIAQAQGGTLVLSHPEHLTHEQQHQLVQLQSHEKRPFRLIGIGSASLVELAASSQIVAELYYIDVYQMHHIDRHTPWEEIWQAMELLVQQGKVLYIGSSNFAGWDIATAQSVATVRHFLGLVAEQSLYNLTARTVELELIPACRHFGLGLIPWSPLAGGLLGGVLKKMASGRRARPAFARLIEQYRPQLEAYEGLCEDLGETPSDVALAWLLQNPVVTAPLIGPRTVEQLQQALHATTITLSDDTMSCLDEIWPGPGGEAPQAYAW
ncbi:response regulator [Klebsiella pneumoniae]|nr:response regulator [Klebsiella pneumoniae]